MNVEIRGVLMILVLCEIGQFVKAREVPYKDDGLLVVDNDLSTKQLYSHHKQRIGDDDEEDLTLQQKQKPAQWNRDKFLSHNEVEENEYANYYPSSGNDVTSEVFATETTTQMAYQAPVEQEQDPLKMWVKRAPGSMFSMTNRMRLASLFLESDSKQDVLNRLAQTNGDQENRNPRRRRRRRKNNRREVMYHPLVRFLRSKRRFGND